MGYDIVRADIWRYFIDKFRTEQGDRSGITISKNIQPITNVDDVLKTIRMQEETLTANTAGGTIEFYPGVGKIWNVKMLNVILTGATKIITFTISLPEGDFNLGSPIGYSDPMALVELSGFPLNLRLRDNQGIIVTIAAEATAIDITAQLLYEEIDG